MAEKQFKVMRVENPDEIPAPISTIEIESEELSKVNAELTEAACRTEDEIIEAASDADALLTIFAPMTRRVLESLPRLKVAVRYGIGYDNIDVDAATDNGVLVVNIPDFCLEEVSDHAISLMLACARQLVRLNDGIKQGRWLEAQSVLYKMAPLYEQTLGLVGCGNIGRVAAKKARCFGLKTIGYDPYVDASLAGECGITLVSLSELLRESDYVSLHTPLNKETWHLIGKNELKQMKPTAYLINTARGSVVDEPALIQALQDKRLAGAGEVVPITDHNKQENQLEAVTVLVNREWTTGTRPTPSADDLYPTGYNTTRGTMEFWNGAAWLVFGDDPIVVADDVPIDVTGAGTVQVRTLRTLATPVTMTLGASAPRAAAATNQPNGAGGAGAATWDQVMNLDGNLSTEIPMTGLLVATKLKLYENGDLVGSIDVMTTV